VYGEGLAEKVMGGGGVKAFPRCSKKSPKELKSQEGIELLVGLNPLLVPTDRYPDQSPVGEARGFGTSGATCWEKIFANDMRE
jgi:hypothetical protein